MNENITQRLAEALQAVLNADHDNTGYEPSLSVFHRACDEALEVLAAYDAAPSGEEVARLKGVNSALRKSAEILQKIDGEHVEQIAELEAERDALKGEVEQANACIRDLQSGLLLAESNRDLATKERDEARHELEALRLINETQEGNSDV